MTKQELEKAIENSESVWSVETNYTTIKKFIKEHKFDKDIIDILEPSAFYKTKAEAEHYLHHANVVRTEHLPFLTWEEFKSSKNITFKAKNGHEFLLKAKQESIYLWWLDTNNIWRTWDLTETNFYKAYDECVRLFRGEE